MALATQCPHCATTFRVASDQLKLRGGIVRCGACHQIFDGNAALIDLDALAAAQAAPASDAAPDEAASYPLAAVPAQAETLADDAAAPAVAAASPGTVGPAQGSAPPQVSPFDANVPAASAPGIDAEPVYTLDFDSTFNPFGILPKAAVPETLEPTDSEPAGETQAELTEPEAERAPEAEARPVEPAPAPAPALDLPIDEELIAAPLPGDDLHDTEPAATAATREARTASAARAPLGSDFPYIPAASIPVRTGPRAKAGRRSKLTPTKIAAPKLRLPETDEPEFVKRSREQEQTGKTRRILMLVGSALLVLALAAQAVVSFRNVWAARYPAAKPALASICTLLGCRVQLPTQIDNLAIETGELQALGPNAYSLTTQLRNNGDLVQAWPNIELALNDANDKPLLRRVFTPAEYLAPGARAGTGFGARAEQPVKLYFELDQLKPSGYHIAVFYP